MYTAAVELVCRVTAEVNWVQAERTLGYVNWVQAWTRLG